MSLAVIDMLNVYVICHVSCIMCIDMGIASGTVTLFRVAENHRLMLRNSELTGGLGWSWSLQLGYVFDNV